MAPCHQLVPVARLPAQVTSLPVIRFPNKLAPNVPNNMLRNPPFCSFVSFI